MATGRQDQPVDRLTAGTATPEAEPVLLGRFVAGGKYVLPSGFHPTMLPDEVTLSSVLTIAATVRATSLHDWAQRSPLVPPEHRVLERDDLDQAIEQDLPALRAVCRHPHDRLGVAEEIARPNRARRIPPVALTYLASHSEDWLNRDHTGVTPARVLTRLFVEELDFYENRLAAKLVDHLRARLAERIRQIRAIARQVDDIRRYRDELTNRASWRNKHRVALLLRDQANVDSQAAAADATLAALTRLRRSLTPLRGSVLYRSVDRQATLPVTVRGTNLFRDDHRYHRVAALWRTWARHQIGMAEARSRMDAFVDAFETFVAFLLVRAADYLELRPEPNSPAPTTPGATVRLAGRDEPVTITLTEERTFLIRRGDRTLATFVPLAHPLTHDSLSAVRGNLRRVRSAMATADTPTVVVYPGLVEERQNTADATLPARAYPTGPIDTRTALGLVPVTPLDIDSIERLARALRWATQGLPSLGYPPVVRMPARVSTKLPNVVTRDGNEVAVLRPFTDAELDALGTGLRRVMAADALVGRDPADVTRAHADLLAAHQELCALSRCPICGIDATAFESRDATSFWCGCTHCTIEWGTQTCGPCKEEFPVLHTGRRRVAATTGDDLDRHFGNEVLAVPCPGIGQDDAGRRFRCPWCNRCPHHGTEPCVVRPSGD